MVMNIPIYELKGLDFGHAANHDHGYDAKHSGHHTVDPTDNNETNSD
jgi:hypothetical protein